MAGDEFKDVESSIMEYNNDDEAQSVHTSANAFTGTLVLHTPVMIRIIEHEKAVPIAQTGIETKQTVKKNTLDIYISLYFIS
jgi:hypothetical protein